MSNAILQAIGRLRRAQPRNPDTMLVCDEIERLLATPKEIKVTHLPAKIDCPTCEARRANARDRVARFRKRRAKNNG